MNYKARKSLFYSLNAVPIKIIGTFCALFLCVATYAQDVTVRGKVTSHGEGMAGVTIVVKGSNGRQGTITSIDGDYLLKVDGKGTLVFSYIGYETMEVPVKGRTTINVEMKETSLAVDEVVITVPYGTVKKSTFTGSAGVVDKKLIASSQVSSVSKALQGSVAGNHSQRADNPEKMPVSIFVVSVRPMPLLHRFT